MRRLHWIGVALGLGWWPLEAAMHAWVFGQGAFMAQLLGGDANELWMRGVISLLFIGFGFFAQRMLDRVVAMEQRLRRKRDRLSRILDTACDAWVAMDDQGRITGWNRSAERMFGIPAHRAMGMALSRAMIPPDLRERYARGLASYRQSGIGPWLYKPVRTRALRADGGEFPVEIVVTPLAGDEGRQEYFAFIRDLETPSLKEDGPE